MSFVEVQFPTDISYGATGGPEWSTDVVELVNGYERRNANWSLPRYRYSVAHAVKTQQQMEALLAFFNARKGKAIGFRFKDWSDFEGTNEFLGYGDSLDATFQLRKAYTSGGQTVYRTIRKPVTGTVSVYVNSVLQTPNTDYTLNTTTGVITFLGSSIPYSGDSVNADFEFDVPVRFDVDRMPVSIDGFEVYSWDSAQIVEVLND